jgi:hypothetical protein
MTYNNEVIDSAYVGLLKRNRTTLILLKMMWLKGKISFKYAMQLYLKPVEVYIVKGELGEQLSSKMGLRLIAKDLFVTWNGYIIDVSKVKTFKIEELKTVLDN